MSDTSKAPEERFRFVSTELPADLFNVIRFTGTEALSTLFHFTIDLVSHDAHVDAEALLGAPAVFTILRADGKHATFTGYPTSVEQRGHFNDLTFYSVELRPTFWKTTQIFSSRIFLNQPLDAVVKELLTLEAYFAFPHELRFSGSYTSPTFAMQYNESVYDYLCWRLEQQGAYFFFEQQGSKDVLVIADAPLTHKTLEHTPKLAYSPQSGLDGSRIEEVISAFSLIQSPLPKQVVIRDFHWSQPDKPIVGMATVSPKGVGDVYLTCEHVADDADATRLAAIRAEELRCHARRFTGRSAVPTLRPGFTFSMEGHYSPAFNRDYLITSVTHEGAQEAFLTLGLGLPLDTDKHQFYHNTFTCVEADRPYRPQRLAPRAAIHGVIHAFIDGAGSGARPELDGLGRYKVLFPFDTSGRGSGTASGWVRMAQPQVGHNSGMAFPLLPGTEVAVTFVNGDPDRPIIAGALANSETGTLVSSQNRNFSGIHTPGGNTLSFGDKNKKQGFALRTAAGHGTSFSAGSTSLSTLNTDVGLQLASTCTSNVSGAWQNLMAGMSVSQKADSSSGIYVTLVGTLLKSFNNGFVENLKKARTAKLDEEFLKTKTALANWFKDGITTPQVLTADQRKALDAYMEKTKADRDQKKKDLETKRTAEKKKITDAYEKKTSKEDQEQRDRELRMIDRQYTAEIAAVDENARTTWKAELPKAEQKAIDDRVKNLTNEAKAATNKAEEEANTAKAKDEQDFGAASMTLKIASSILAQSFKMSKKIPKLTKKKAIPYGVAFSANDEASSSDLTVLPTKAEYIINILASILPVLDKSLKLGSDIALSGKDQKTLDKETGKGANKSDDYYAYKKNAAIFNATTTTVTELLPEIISMLFLCIAAKTDVAFKPKGVSTVTGGVLLNAEKSNITLHATRPIGLHSQNGILLSAYSPEDGSGEPTIEETDSPSPYALEAAPKAKALGGGGIKMDTNISWGMPHANNFRHFLRRGFFLEATADKLLASIKEAAEVDALLVDAGEERFIATCADVLHNTAKVGITNLQLEQITTAQRVTLAAKKWDTYAAPGTTIKKPQKASAYVDLRDAGLGEPKRFIGNAAIGFPKTTGLSLGVVKTSPTHGVFITTTPGDDQGNNAQGVAQDKTTLGLALVNKYATLLCKNEGKYTEFVLCEQQANLMVKGDAETYVTLTPEACTIGVKSATQLQVVEAGVLIPKQLTIGDLVLEKSKIGAGSAQLEIGGQIKVMIDAADKPIAEVKVDPPKDK